mgnify:CR=1 FL=1
MDYNGELTWQQLMHIERLANEAVYRNVSIRTEYPAPERLAHMEYRSKLDLKEDVRIVTVEATMSAPAARRTCRTRARSARSSSRRSCATAAVCA